MLADQTTTLPPAPRLPSAAIVAPDATSTVFAVATVSVRYLVAAFCRPGSRRRPATVPPTVPEASRREAAPSAIVSPLTTIDPPASPSPTASSVAETETFLPETRIAPPFALPADEAERATTFWLTSTLPPSPAVRKIRPPVLAAGRGDDAVGVAGERIDVTAVGAQFGRRRPDLAARLRLGVAPPTLTTNLPPSRSPSFTSTS